MAYVNPYEREQRRKAEQTELQRLYAREEQGGTPASAPVEGEEPGIGRRAFDTVLDVRNNIGIGAWGSIEGMVDSLVLGSIGAVGGVFSSRFADTMKKAIQYNVTEDFLFPLYNDMHRATTGGDFDSGETSYLRKDGTVNSIARGIGGMLPAVAVSIATMGAAAPAAAGSTAASAGGSAMTAAQAAKLAQTLSTVTMAAGAAGQAEQEAYQDGADFYGGQAYGVLRGATEAVTEYALGGTTKLITGGGKAMLPGVRKSVASVGLKRVAKAALEEGLEEGISEMADPLTRTTYKGKEALAEYADPAFYGQVLRAVKDGSLTGLVFQGTVGHAMGNTGKAADMQEIRSELNTLKKKKLNLSKNNKLTNEAYATISADVRENYRVMEGVLKKATPEKRAALMEEYGLSDKFDGNGTIKADFSALLDRRATVGQTAPDGENGSPAGPAGPSGGFDRRTASVDAEAEKVAKVLAKEGREQFTDVDSLSREGKENLKKVKRVMNALSDASGGAVGQFVIAKEAFENGYIDSDTGYIVLSADVLEKGHSVAGTAQQSWFETTIHEALHGVEGTETFVKLVQQMGKVTFRPALLEKLNSRGYIGEFGDTWQQINDRLNELTKKDTSTMTAEELDELADFKSEYAALMAEEVLGTRHFARRLLSADAGLFERILGGVQDVIAKLAKIKDPEAAEVAAEFEKAEDLFLEALAEKGLRFEKGKIIGAGDEKDDPKHSEVKFSIGHDKNGNKYWHIETGKDIFRGIREKEKMREAAFDYIIDNRDHQVIVEDLDGRKIEFIRLSAEEFTRSEESQDLYEKDPEIFKKKMRMIPSLEDLVKYSSVSWTSPDHKNHKSYHKKGFINYRGKVRIDNVIFDYIIRVGQAQKFNGFHDINLEVAQYLPHATKSDTSDIKGATPNNKIPHSNKNVNPSDEISSENSYKPVQKSRKATQQNTEKSYRYYRSPQKVMSAWGHAMFVDDPYSSETYGDFAFGVEHSELVRIDELRDEILAKMREDYENGELPDDMEYAIDQNGLSFEELADEYAPEDIVISAQGWDNGQFVEWFYNRIIEPKDIKGIKTPDGAIVFDESIISRETDFDHGTAVKKSRKTVTATPPEVDHLTPMQKQTVANYTRAKVYTKAEALAVVEDMAHFLDENYGFDGGMGEASGFVTLTKTVKDGAARKLWEAYNSAKTDGERRKIARELADLLMAEAKLVTLASDEELAEAREITAALGRYFHKIDLAGIAGEIKASGLDAKALRGRWGAKKGEPAFTADQLKGEIEDKLGIPIPADNEAEIFFWIDEWYRTAADKIGNYNKALLFGAGNGVALAEDQAIRDQIATEIFRSFKEGGKPSEWTKRLLYEVEPFYDKETEETGVTKAVFNASKALSFAKLNVHVAALSAGVKDWKAGVFLNQSQPKYQDIFKNTIGQLSKVNHGGRLIDPVKTRELIGKLGEWYTEETMTAMGLEVNAEIAGFIEQIAEGEGGLTVADMAALESVIQYMKHTAETYQTVWMNGKRVKAMPVVREYVKIMQANQDLRIGKVDYILGSAYVRMYGDPHMIVRYMDKYKHGFYTEIYERLRQGAIKARVYRKRLDDQIAEVMDKYPKYFKELEGRRILLHGSDMPVAEAMSLWMSLNRDQALDGLLINGYCFNDPKPAKPQEKYRRVFGFTGDEKIRDKDRNILPQWRQKIDEMQADIWEQLSEADRAYIGIVYKLLNQDCKKLKSDTDLARMGYTNAIEDFYFPIRRDNQSQDIDRQTFYDEMSRVSNASFNKDTNEYAENQLLIEPIHIVVNRHLRGVTMYAALGTVIDDYKMLKNLNAKVEQNHNKPVSVATEEHNTWDEGRKYFEQLMSDIQEIKPGSDETNKIVGKLRGNYAKFQLAANPKVIATQLSSLFAGMNIIDPDVMIYAFNPKVNGRDVYDYSELAEIRASENTAAMAQGLLDEAGDKLMAPIGWMDSWVVRRLWVASQHQIAKSGPKLGTEENKKAAAKLLDKVILETQQNALATEKSQAARSQSEIQKMLTMFTSDAVKGVGQLLDAIGEITVIRNEAKVRKTPVDTTRLAAAKRRAGRAAGSLAAVAVYGAILAAIIKKLLDRDDEWTWIDFLSEVGGGLLGGLPIIKEAYEMYWGSGYGMEDMSVAAVNDLMTSTKDTFEDLGALTRGELSGREALRGGRNLLYSLGQVTGMPIRNAYTWSRRLVGIVAPDAAYKMENAFAKQPYASDIAKAIEREDEGRLETVIGVVLDENVGEVTSSAVRKEMKRLVVSGMDVLPRGVGDTVTVDGEAVKLTARQKTAFKEVYSEANKSVERMVGLDYYANASDEAKAKAIKRVYGIYYNRAIEDLLGVELENKNTLLSRAINPEVLAVVMAVCGEITADVDKDGKVVAGSKRKKVEAFVESLKLKAAQKYMIMGALGYKNKKGREKVLAYVNGLGLSKSEREAIMAYSGY